MGQVQAPRTCGQLRSPAKNLLPLSKYYSLLGGFFRMIFEKINKIRTQRPGRKKPNLTGIRVPNDLLFSPPLKGTENKQEGDQLQACPFHRGTRAGELVQPFQASLPCLPPLVLPADHCLQTWNVGRPAGTLPCPGWTDMAGPHGVHSSPAK